MRKLIERSCLAFARSRYCLSRRGRILDPPLLEAVDLVHDALKLGAVEEIEGAFLAWEHFEGDAAGGCDHAGCFFGSEIACGDRFDRQLNEDAQPADAAAFIIDLFLCGAGNIFVFGSGLWHRAN